MVKNPSCNAGDPSSILGQGTKISHAAEPLKSYTTTREPEHCVEKALLDTAKVLHATTKTQCPQINT